MSFLNKLVITGVFLGCAGFGVAAHAITAEEQAEIASQCRQEASLYGIAEEQSGEYVDGCIQAMGGMPEMVSGDADVEEITTGETDAEDVNVEEIDVAPEESGYADGAGDEVP